MMEAPKSPFKGINPYLMSFLQTVGTEESPSSFPSFHSDHLTHIKDFLNDLLPPQYIALSEPSMQIQGRDFDEGDFQKDSNLIPDVTIYKPYVGSGSTQGSAATPSLVLDFDINEVKEWTSVVIRELRAAEHHKHGDVIVRIELLSPSNMLGRQHGDLYRQSRKKTIASETKLIEIDYLHEYRSPIPNMPLYPHHPQAKVYNISLTNVKTEVYFWGVNDLIPLIEIPLKGDDSIVFDFNLVYDYTWKKSRFWFYLDYQKDPERMNTYSPEDQNLIRQITKEISA
jgi:hypothetical protein